MLYIIIKFSYDTLAGRHVIARDKLDIMYNSEFCSRCFLANCPSARRLGCSCTFTQKAETLILFTAPWFSLMYLLFLQFDCFHFPVISFGRR